MKPEPRLLLVAASAYDQIRNFGDCVRALGLFRHPAILADMRQGSAKNAPTLALVVYKDDAFTQYIMFAPNVENFSRYDRPHDVHPGDIDLGGDDLGDHDLGDDDLGCDDVGGGILGCVDPGGVDPGGADPRGDAPEGDA